MDKNNKEDILISNSNRNSMGIIDFVKIYIKNKKYIYISTFTIGILSAILMFFVVDSIYLSKSVVKTSGKSNSLSGLIGENIPDLSDLSSLTGGSFGKDMALYENILLSRRALEEVIIKFNLNSEWKFNTMQEAVKNFKDNIIDIKKDKIAGTMEIGIYDTYPQRAKEINDFLIYQLNKINIELNVQNAKNNREFIEKRYQTAKIDLRNAEDSIKMFQEKFGLAPDIYAKATAQAQIQLEIEIKSEEVKLDILKKMISPDQPEILIQEEKIKALKNELQNINNSDSEYDILSLKGKPEIIINFIRLQRNIEIQSKIITFILPLYEQAKIEEKKEMPSVLVLDSPNVPEKRDRPKRMKFILIAMFSTFILTYVFFVLKSRWHYYKIMLKN